MKRMDDDNVKKGFAHSFSFVKGFKDKITGTVRRESRKDDVDKKLKEAKEEIAGLKSVKKDLARKYQLVTSDFRNKSAIESEIKKIDEEKKDLEVKISQREEDVRIFYATKDARLKQIKIDREKLKVILDEKRSIHGDVSDVNSAEREIKDLRTQLDEAKSAEENSAREIDELETRIRFANANIETLIVDSTVAKKALDDLKKFTETKKESVKTSEGVRTDANEVLVKLNELKRVKDGAAAAIESFKRGIGRLKEQKEAIRKAEIDMSPIPKKVAELTAKGIVGGEKVELIKKQDLLSAEIEKLKADEKQTMENIQKDKKVLENIERCSLETKRTMISAGLKEYASRVDSESVDVIKMDVESKIFKLTDSVSAEKTELDRVREETSQKRIALTKMTEELNRLMKEAEEDKKDVELQRTKIKGAKDRASALRAVLEAKLKTKNDAMGHVIKVNMEVQRLETAERNVVEAIRSREIEVDSVDRDVECALAEIRVNKERLEQLEGMGRFFSDKIDVIKKLERLDASEKELVLSREVAAKYESEVRRLKRIENEKTLLTQKVELIDEEDLSVQDAETKLAKICDERSRLKAELEPLRSELDFVLEKRDNIEMKISFEKEALYKTRERKKTLERKLEFITSESGSVKGLQEKLVLCEKKFMEAEKNIAEIQTRLNFTAATEDAVKERVTTAERALKKVDAEIETVNVQLQKSGSVLPDLRLPVSGLENKLSDEKAAGARAEAEVSALKIEQKKNSIEVDALAKTVEDLTKELEENKQRESTISKTETSYKADLEKQRKIEVEIEALNVDIKKETDVLDSKKSEVENLQDKKRELMEESMKGVSAGSASEEESEIQAKVKALRDERKTFREKIKAIDVDIKKAKASSGDVDPLRIERDDLRKEVDRINKEIDTAKDGGQELASAPNDTAAKLALQIGELDIRVLSLSKEIDKIESKIEIMKGNLKKNTDFRNDIVLKIEDQKKILKPLAEIRAKIKLIKKERGSYEATLKELKLEKDNLVAKIQTYETDMKTVMNRVEDIANELKAAKDKLNMAEINADKFKKALDEAVNNRSVVFAEFNRMKAENDSIIANIRSDRETLERETAAAERARKDLEGTRKQLSEAMSILTGKTGSVDSLKLEIISSAEEEKDIIDRIGEQELEYKTLMAAVENIESGTKPKQERLAFITWAKKVVEGKLKFSRVLSELADIKEKYKELNDVRELYDTYGDLSKSKLELRTRVGKLKSYFELETQLVTKQQETHEINAKLEELTKIIEEKEDLARKLDEKYKDVQEEKVRIQGALNDLTHQFEEASAKWGTVEELSRIRESLEIKINTLSDRLGGMEKAGGKVDRLESEKTELIQRIKTLETKCRALEDERSVLKQSLEKSRSDFENAFAMLKKSSDEVKGYIS